MQLVEHGHATFPGGDITDDHKNVIVGFVVNGVEHQFILSNKEAKDLVIDVEDSLDMNSDAHERRPRKGAF